MDTRPLDPAHEAQFVALLNQYRALLHKVVRVYAHSAADRDDLFQEIVLQLWRAYPSFEQRAKFSTWMYRIALNVAISGLRKRRIDTQTLDEGLLNLPDLADESVEQREQLTQLYAALEYLSDGDKALVLLYFEDLSYEEMAEVTGLTEGHLRVKMLRIRERLRHIFNKRYQKHHDA
jgi:RNA polymerase sigma factor (sigma-70 family)